MIDSRIFMLGGGMRKEDGIDWGDYEKEKIYVGNISNNRFNSVRSYSVQKNVNASGCNAIICTTTKSGTDKSLISIFNRYTSIVYACIPCVTLLDCVQFRPNQYAVLFQGGLQSAFDSCSSLEYVFFNKLNNIFYGKTPSGTFSGLSLAFEGCTSLKEIHFKASLEGDASCTQSIMQCPTTTQILFDL